MKTTTKGLFLASILVSLALHPKNARAEADTFGLGSGHTGAVTVSLANTVINSYEPITVNIAKGDKTITVGNGATFKGDDLVLVWQPTSLASPPMSGDQTKIALAGLSTGSFEFARVKSVAGNVVTLTNAIASAGGYVGGASQMVKVPEYTTLTVKAGASIKPSAWNGQTGGVVAFLATGTVTIDGAIQANAVGMRGGALENDNTVFGCAALDGPAGAGGNNAGGAHKGEGLVPGAYSNKNGSANATYGNGDVSIGGGGGDCHNAGGGGGGHGGQGGNGGLTWQGDNARNVGGLGGSALDYSPLTRMSLGGAGGSGEENDMVGTGGGSGGGVIFARANAFTGTGAITADGASVTQAAQNDGAGGGGAGGAIVLFSATSADCGSIHANGGDGGSTAALHGPGAGGAGGVIMVQSASGLCAGKIAVDPGIAGTAAMQPRGAGNGGKGVKPPPPNGGFAPINCDIPINKCGGCVLNADCPNNLGVCDGTTNECVQCLTNNDCKDPAKKICDPKTQACVQCTSDTDCAMNEACDLVSEKCIPKVSDGGLNDGGGNGDGGNGDGGGNDDGGGNGDGGGKGDGGGYRDATDSDDTGTNGDGGFFDGSLEGGGIGCNVSTAPTTSGFGLFGLGVAALVMRLRRRARDKKIRGENVR